jgi:hypothetical protein
MANARAIIDLATGRTVVINELEEVFLMDGKCPVPRKRRGYNIAEYLESLNPDYLEYRDIGEYPYADLHAYLIHLETRRFALSFFHTSFNDGWYNLAQRLDCAQSAERLLSDPIVRRFVEHCLLMIELPMTANLDGLPEEGEYGKILQKVREKWRSPALVLEYYLDTPT